MNDVVSLSEKQNEKKLQEAMEQLDTQMAELREHANEAYAQTCKDFFNGLVEELEQEGYDFNGSVLVVYSDADDSMGIRAFQPDGLKAVSLLEFAKLRIMTTDHEG